MNDITIWLIGIIASVVITILLTDPLSYLLTWVFGGVIKYNKGIKGIWLTKYQYSSKGVQKEEINYFLIKQFGKYVLAKSLETSPYKIRGKLDAKSFLTGTWIMKTSDNREYHGSFQLTIAPQGTELNGKWLGFNSKYEIMTGDWHWELVTRNSTKKEVKKFFDKSEIRELEQ